MGLSRESRGAGHTAPVARLAVTIATTVLVATTGCGGQGGGGASDAKRPGASRGPVSSTSADAATPPGSTASRAVESPSPTVASQPRTTVSGGWTVTVYYTAVERFHGGEREPVVGCRGLDCSRGGDDLGAFPRSFVDAVRAEGTGRTAAGTYLNWSDDVGFWIDQAPRDAGGRRLRPFESAAADPDVLAPGTRFAIVSCGHDEAGGKISGGACERLRSGTWTITDEFTPGLGGRGRVDVYIGEETGPNFTENALYVTLVGATLSIG